MSSSTLMDSSSMFAALAAAANQPSTVPAEKLRLFGQFVGVWAIDVTYFGSEGEPCRIEGEWRFRWTLDNRAIHDVWVAPRRNSGPIEEEACTDLGAMLRFYDAKIDAWRATPLGPARTGAESFVAREVEGDIVIDGNGGGGAAARWIFSEITPQSFRWRALESGDGWRTHRCVQEMRARRTV
ncbi:MAG TPA: hypothetical protein VGD81_03515 [Opitutaceae bacterium]